LDISDPPTFYVPLENPTPEHLRTSLEQLIK